VKTRLANQSIKNPHYGGIVDCCRKIISADGVFGFYKGTLSPLIGVGPQVAAQFATNEAVKRALNKLTEGKKEDGLLSLK
jgi:solute carrier family 25 carnitine/acylcarnitine transporter 20/29